MFANIRMVAFALLVTLNTAWTALVVCLFAIPKIIVPIKPFQIAMSRLANAQFRFWATLNLWMLKANNRIEWQIEGSEDISLKQSYMLISNHLSWADIVILSSVIKDKAPMPKFFLKHDLLYVPFVGLACWGLNMPFMKRHSREYLIRHPERRNDDFNAIKRASEQFKGVPTTVVNFVEGTRVNQEKLSTMKTPYNHLLKPKTGGVAFALDAMRHDIDGILDFTIAYPENQESPFKDLLQGKLTKIVVKIDLCPMDENTSGDYFNDKAFKRRFHAWLNNQWQEKDEYLSTIYK
ncbi:1-acyl-sn-glycerol-3-phosphate acyltransferase [Vibrio ishigakensis]|uniref:1-acyl-sn-glycerol-3-phosphate acyltransferase n=1 Tax=Vibrio ishigakensis TaxID=1481914 RepID=A0A0B8NVW7_9VIBR|nr:acyltransferase [Vibrio ishigakensis]GAM54874.1 1-acyl-sn-glycerol-3-phosphate acyltransferase [Vibrio ishigakensis]